MIRLTQATVLYVRPDHIMLDVQRYQIAVPRNRVPKKLAEQGELAMQRGAVLM